VLYLPENARFSKLVARKEGDNGGTAEALVANLTHNLKPLLAPWE
jgi:hypothetical protein